MLILTLVIDETKTEGKNWSAVGNMPVEYAQSILMNLVVDQRVAQELKKEVKE